MPRATMDVSCFILFVGRQFGWQQIEFHEFQLDSNPRFKADLCTAASFEVYIHLAETGVSKEVQAMGAREPCVERYLGPGEARLPKAIGRI